eukprot:GFYU01005759.1.p1 GENE.GFYU01005759.1~~GFYU01005759.1.p1  ORF type:complete len:412 (-),score=84.92 GFYU01005759.1:56-1252(-)
MATSLFSLAGAIVKSVQTARRQQNQCTQAHREVKTLAHGITTLEQPQLLCKQYHTRIATHEIVKNACSFVHTVLADCNEFFESVPEFQEVDADSESSAVMGLISGYMSAAGTLQTVGDLLTRVILAHHAMSSALASIAALQTGPPSLIPWRFHESCIDRAERHFTDMSAGRASEIPVAGGKLFHKSADKSSQWQLLENECCVWLTNKDPAAGASDATVGGAGIGGYWLKISNLDEEDSHNDDSTRDVMEELVVKLGEVGGIETLTRGRMAVLLTSQGKDGLDVLCGDGDALGYLWTTDVRGDSDRRASSGSGSRSCYVLQFQAVLDHGDDLTAEMFETEVTLGVLRARDSDMRREDEVATVKRVLGYADGEDGEVDAALSRSDSTIESLEINLANLNL